MSKKLVIIDSHALIHRCYHALPPLTTQKGQMVNAAYGFTSILLKVIKELQPDYIVAAFDIEAKTFRHDAYEGYKAQRKKADGELYAQIPLVKQMLRNFNIPCCEKEGYEADDVIGTIVKKITGYPRSPLDKKGEHRSARLGEEKNVDIEIIIVTGDLDTLQLVNDATKVYTLKKGISDVVIYDKNAIFERYGLVPEQIVDFKSLKGDPSDNIPGVPGIGEKTAIELIKKFNTIEALYEELEKIPSLSSSKKEKSGVISRGVKVGRKIFENLLYYKDQAFFSKELSTIKCDVPLDIQWESLRYIKDFNKEETIKLFKELEFYSLIDRLHTLFATKQYYPAPAALEPEIPEAKDRYHGLIEQIKKLYWEGIFSKKIYDLETALLPVIQNMERIGVKIDDAYLKKTSKRLSKELQEIEKQIYDLVGEAFNLNSPRQLSKILFEKLEISKKGLRKTPKGVIISTNAKELTKLRDAHPVITLILRYRELSKLKSTYTDSLLEAIDPASGRIHTQFHPLGTVTGRLSSSDPNLQNIPIRTELGNEIRKAFVAQKDYVLISGDYSQLELRIMAALAGDTKMIQAFSEGKDIHSLTASEIYKVSLEQVTSRMRGVAKAVNFGIMYGMGVYGLAEGTGISKDEARDFIQKYRDDFPQITMYIETLKQRAYEKGYAETYYGRKRLLPELKSKSVLFKRAAERMAVNMPIQGTEADIVKMAMIEVDNNIPKNKARLLLQVHDELVLEVKKEYQEQISKDLKYLMEKVNRLPVPLCVDISLGQNWGEMKKIS